MIHAKTAELRPRCKVSRGPVLMTGRFAAVTCETCISITLDAWRKQSAHVEGHSIDRTGGRTGPRDSYDHLVTADLLKSPAQRIEMAKTFGVEPQFSRFNPNP